MGSKKDLRLAKDAITLGGLQNRALRASSSVLEALEEAHGPNKWLHGRVKVGVGVGACAGGRSWGGRDACVEAQRVEQQQGLGHTCTACLCSS